VVGNVADRFRLRPGAPGLRRTGPRSAYSVRRAKRWTGSARPASVVHFRLGPQGAA